jgi:hypothetical protein
VAHRDGGGIKFTQTLPNISDDTKLNFLNNSAIYGPNIACYPLYFKELKNVKQENYQFFISGQQSLSTSNSTNSTQQRRRILNAKSG